MRSCALCPRTPLDPVLHRVVVLHPCPRCEREVCEACGEFDVDGITACVECDAAPAHEWWRIDTRCESCPKEGQPRACSDRMRNLCDSCWRSFRGWCEARFRDALVTKGVA